MAVVVLHHHPPKDAAPTCAGAFAAKETFVEPRSPRSQGRVADARRCEVCWSASPALPTPMVRDGVLIGLGQEGPPGVPRLVSRPGSPPPMVPRTLPCLEAAEYMEDPDRPPTLPRFVFCCTRSPPLQHREQPTTSPPTSASATCRVNHSQSHERQVDFRVAKRATNEGRIGRPPGPPRQGRPVNRRCFFDLPRPEGVSIDWDMAAPVNQGRSRSSPRPAPAEVKRPTSPTRARVRRAKAAARARGQEWGERRAQALTPPKGRFEGKRWIRDGCGPRTTRQSPASNYRITMPLARSTTARLDRRVQARVEG